MTDTETPPRRSLAVMLLDAMMRLAFGPAPSPKVSQAGEQLRPRAGRYLLAAGALIAVAATALLVVVLVRSPDDPTPGPGPAAALPGLASRPPGSSSATSPATTGPTSTPATAPTSTVADPTTKPVPGGPQSGSHSAAGTAVPLTANYATTGVGLLGYQMTVTVANPGRATRKGWELKVTFPRSTLEVADVDGATATQKGAVWTFTPNSTTARVAAAGSVRVVFSVRGAALLDAAPRSCSIDANPCTTA